MTTTEQTNPNTAEIDKLPTLEALAIINREDQKVAQAVEKVLPAVALAVDGIVQRLERGGRLFYSGTGTSGRLGVLDAAECPPTFGVAPDLVQGVIAGGYDACYKAVEASEDDREAGAKDLQARGFTPDDVLVGIAASGRTPYTIGAIEYARGIGALTICITCNENTALAAATEIPIEAIVGPEVIAGSTRLKSGTAQKLVLNMLSTMTMVRLGYVTGNRMTNLKTSNLKLRQRATGLVMAECGLDEAAAIAALEAANWDLRIAIVMTQASVSKSVAEEALQQAGYTISRAITLLNNQR
ncbi:MAG TPA: N-acetylmuramic acid 6-phosphate etherase [Blastocatellia bacterium]|nr:N-acetylmuramic acid 6-phosphate etherase [Blastocatellia bacterium]HMV82848.1 N-acetylmuramic acid 6-phosphate etherase [Blastocatellia bacterium]HMX30095.1 N-acetylmuramic acid 6-phosphate etherase [Blastocatellia bacterium]HMY72999.1 N-acetylmuramic acid 6-phosphate etherase [Blastocatellia bacterium]HMZ18776.1 N-acetylmuramic acid 6-phosphate etherase [Blastocatellia bacterium]